MKKSIICPITLSTNIIEIVYGMPSPELCEMECRGEIILGGCGVDKDNPRWYCKKCKYEFR